MTFGQGREGHNVKALALQEKLCERVSARQGLSGVLAGKAKDGDN
jgi:hypothetical protein